MKILKNIFIAIGIILFIVAVGVYFLPKSYSINKTVEIKQPASLVYGQIADFNNASKWDPWKEKDTEMKYWVENEPGKIGHRSNWDSKKMGAGSLTIAFASTNESISEDLEITSPMNANAKVMWILDEEKGVTKVSWTIRGGLKYPFGRLYGLEVEKDMGGNMEHGLDGLRKICEAMPAPVAAANDTSGMVQKM